MTSELIKGLRNCFYSAEEYKERTNEYITFNPILINKWKIVMRVEFEERDLIFWETPNGIYLEVVREGKTNRFSLIEPIPEKMVFT
jgi:hypothetical protein